MWAGQDASDEMVDQLADDVEKYTLANHIFWGLWGLLSVIALLASYRHTHTHTRTCTCDVVSTM